MSPLDRLEVLWSEVLGWLPAGSAAASPSAKSRSRRLASWRVLSTLIAEILIVFTFLGVLQLLGWETWAAGLAGAASAVAMIIGVNFVIRRWPTARLYAEIGGYAIQPQYLGHIIDWYWGGLGGLVVEGAVSEVDRQEVQDKLAALRKGDKVSYSVIADNGKAIAGNAVVKGVVTKVKGDGKLRFTINMRRG